MSIVQPRLQGFSVLEMAFILAAFIVCRASVPPNYSLLGHSRVSRRCSCRSPNYSLKWPLSLRPLLFFFKKARAARSTWPFSALIALPICLTFLGLGSIANSPQSMALMLLTTAFMNMAPTSIACHPRAVLERLPPVS